MAIASVDARAAWRCNFNSREAKKRKTPDNARHPKKPKMKKIKNGKKCKNAASPLPPRQVAFSLISCKKKKPLIREGDLSVLSGLGRRPHY